MDTRQEYWGGRLLGEACHFVDLLRFLSQSEIDKVNFVNVDDLKPCPDNFSIQLKFKNGSIGIINYLSNGNKAFPKERLEVFSGNAVICLNNFRKLEAWGIKSFKTKRSFKQDKGQTNCIHSFLKSIENNTKPPIPIDQLFEVQDILLSVGNS